MTGNATAAGRRAARSFVTLVSSEAIGQVLTFIVNAYLARTLGKEGFGVWVFAVSVITYLGFLVDAGTETWGTREVSTDHRRLPAALHAVIGLRLRVAAVAIAILLLLAFALPIDMTRRLLLAGGAVTLAATAFQAPWALRGLETMFPVALGTLMQRILMLVLVLVLVRSPASVGGVTLWQGLADFTAAGIWMIALARRVSIPAVIGAHPRWRETLVQSWPFGVARVLRGAMFTINIALIPFFWSDSVVGDYGAAQRLSAPLLVLSSIFGIAVFPAITRAARAGAKVEYPVLAATFRLLSVIFVPIVVGGAVVAAPVISLVFSSAYETAAIPLALLLGAMLLMVLSDNLRRVLHARHLQVADLRLVSIAAGASLVFNLVAIPLWGAVGAGAAALASEALMFGLVLIQLRDDAAMAALRGVVRPLVAALIMAAAIAPFARLHAFFAILAGGAIYVPLIWLLRVNVIRDLHSIEPEAAALPEPAEAPLD